MEQPSPVFGKFERVRGIAVMVSPLDDEGERISEDLSTGQTARVVLPSPGRVAHATRLVAFCIVDQIQESQLQSVPKRNILSFAHSTVILVMPFFFENSSFWTLGGSHQIGTFGQ